MNLGLLAVASAARRQGHSVVVYDWLGPQQCSLEARLPDMVADFRPDIVGFSIPSGYAEPYLKTFARLVKVCAPAAKIVVGGQYHVGFRVAEVLSAVPEVDAIAPGAGENIDWDAFSRGQGHIPGLVLRGNDGAPRATAKITELEPLDWSVLGFDVRAYAPSIEIARGCPFTCAFCSLSGAPERLNRTTVEAISNQLSFWTELWDGLPRVPIYAECPVFFTNAKNFDAYRQAFGPFSDRLEWRVQARVDSIDPTLFDDLYDLGLRVIDIGLESASPRMLGLMQKTQTPDRYLRQAGVFIENAASAGIGVKLNILLYPGEDVASAAETEDFISHHSKSLAGIAAGTTLEFPGTTLSGEMDQLGQRFGTKRVHDPVLADCGIYPLDLSADFSYQEARNWCIRVSKTVMDARKYYDLKRIGYYPPSLTYEDFIEAAHRVPAGTLPFTLNGNPHEIAESSSIAEQVVQWDKLR